MIHEVGRLLREPLIGERRDYHLDGLLPHLLRHPLRTAADQPGRVGVLRHLLVALGDGTGEPLDHLPETDLM